MAGDNKNGFMKGAAILSISTLVVKALGLLFSIRSEERRVGKEW